MENNDINPTINKILSEAAVFMYCYKHDLNVKQLTEDEINTIILDYWAMPKERRNKEYPVKVSYWDIEKELTLGNI